MNQYGVSTEDPIAASDEMARMMNVMAAGAKEGSAELPQVKTALEQAGMAAKAANVSFEETNAAIQVLDKAGKKGSEGGVALRNTLATLSEGRFLPKDTQAALRAAGVDIEALGDKSIPLARRLRELEPIMGDSALVTKVFGKENSNAALALVSGISEMERMTGALTGTNTAYEQAAIVMESPAEKAKRLKAQMDDLKISLFNGTNGWLGYASVVGDATKDITNLWPLVTVLSKVIGINTITTALSAATTDIATGATTRWKVVQAAFNTTMWANPVTWITLAVIALVAVIAYAIYKTDGWGKAWDHTVKGATYIWQGFTAMAQLAWDGMVNGIMIGLNRVKSGWYEFRNDVGLGETGDNDAMIAGIEADTERRKKELVDGATNVATLNAKAAVEFRAAAGSIHTNDKTLQDGTNGISKAIGLPGATGAGSGAGGGHATGLAKTGRQANQAIATGGTRNTTVNIHIGNQIGSFTISTSNLQEGTQKLRDMIIDETTRAIQMGAALGARD
jgi:TP901 family phage tail tape measure protein